MACAVLKVSHGEEIRRMELEKSEMSYPDVTQSIAELFPGLKECTAKYFDEEGDACTLCEASFKDFLAVSRATVRQAVTDKTCQATLLLKLQLVGPAVPKEQPCSGGAFRTEESNHQYTQQKQSQASAEASACVFPAIVADGRKLRIECNRGDDPVQIAAKFAQANCIQEEEVAAINLQQDTTERKDEKDGKGEAHDTMFPESIESKIMNDETTSHGQGKNRPCGNVACTYQVTWPETHCCYACATGQGHGRRCEGLEQAWALKTSRTLKTLPEINARILVAMVPDSMHPLDKEDIFELSENLDNLTLKSDLDRESRRKLLKQLDEIEASLGSKPRVGC